MSGFPVSLQQSSIDGVIHLISNIQLCEGILKDDGYSPKTFYEENISKIYMTIMILGQNCASNF